ncbi:MAG TPA: DUF1707 domain-containing protein [Streptosporangiaceae bacterium]|jgi:hypothetical protein
MNDRPSERPDLRVSDADRDAAITELSGHFQDGRLDMDEFQQRIDAASSARTRADLDLLLADLPRPARQEPHPVPQHTGRAAAVLALASIALAGLAVTVVSGAFGAWQWHAHGHWHGGGPPWFLIVIPILLIARLARGARGPRRGPR